jgi:hypothetical protein
MKGVMIHGDHAEQVIVIFCDGFAGPVAENIARREIFKAATKGAFICCHERQR